MIHLTSLYTIIIMSLYTKTTWICVNFIDYYNMINDNNIY